MAWAVKHRSQISGIHGTTDIQISCPLVHRTLDRLARQCDAESASSGRADDFENRKFLVVFFDYSTLQIGVSIFAERTTSLLQSNWEDIGFIVGFVVGCALD